MKQLRIIFATLLAIALTACQKDNPPRPIIDPTGLGEGFFVLNEGAYHGNNSTLDFYSYDSNELILNIFENRNPNETMGLGDLGNDLAMHRGMLFAVMNGSGLVHVMDAQTAKKIATVTVKNPREIAFSGGFAYVTSYGDALQFGDGDHLGFVAKIDLGTFKVVAECPVGRQPDGLAVVGDGKKLYVCNSGGYGTHETYVSVIDLATFTVVDRVEVAPNMRHLMDVGDGELVAVPWQPTTLYHIDTQSNTVAELPIVGLTMAFNDRTIYTLGVDWSTGSPVAAYNSMSEGVLKGNFITDGTDSQIVIPYGLAIDSDTKEIVVTDAGNFANDGKIYCFSPDGKLKWSKTVGVAPSKVVFLR